MNGWDSCASLFEESSNLAVEFIILLGFVFREKGRSHPLFIPQAKYDQVFGNFSPKTESGLEMGTRVSEETKDLVRLPSPGPGGGVTNLLARPC